jgi:hypothetical protein
MAAGSGAWLLHSILGWDSFAAPILGDALPTALGATVLSLAAYLIGDGWAATPAR